MAKLIKGNVELTIIEENGVHIVLRSTLIISFVHAATVFGNGKTKLNQEAERYRDQSTCFPTVKMESDSLLVAVLLCR